MEFIALNWVLIAGIIFVLFMLAFEPIRMRMLGIEPATVFDAVALSNHENAIFVDVRESKETAAGIINGAYKVPLSSFESSATQLDKLTDKPVIVYCRSGNRSLSGAGKLRKKGFQKVYNLSGGIVAWEKEKLPLESQASLTIMHSCGAIQMASVSMYCSRFCPYCIMADRLLAKKGQAVEKIYVDDEPSLRNDMLTKSNGRTSVPQIFINNIHIGGYTDMVQLDHSQKLDPLLQDAS